MQLADRFRAYAVAAEAEGSPVYAEWAHGVAGDDDVLRVVEAAPEARRQPVLVLATCRWLGASPGPWSRLREWVLGHAAELVAELGRRSVQTNDVRRSAPLSLALARLEGPVALLEVGASAGLCLYPDRVAYEGGGRTWGDVDSTVRVSVDVSGPVGRPVVPEVAWRGGLDLDPLDVLDDDDVAWLETLLPPGPTDRTALLARAVSMARTAPPRLERGDAVDDLARVAALAPPSARLVVVSTGTLVYLPGRRRQQFVDAVRALDAHWVSYERADLLHDVGPVVDPPVTGPDAFALLALDGAPIALGDAHGTRLTLLHG